MLPVPHRLVHWHAHALPRPAKIRRQGRGVARALPLALPLPKKKPIVSVARVVVAEGAEGGEMGRRGHKVDAFWVWIDTLSLHFCLCRPNRTIWVAALELL